MTEDITTDEPILTPVDLRDYLLIRGVTTDLSDTQLCTLIEYKINELTGLIGIDVLPRIYTDIRMDYKDNMILLNHYPVSSITSININNKELTNDDYTLDAELGIIYFKEYLYGELQTVYESCLPSFMINTIFTPLLVDAIEYSLPENKDKYGVTSIKEGDVSINYSTDTSLGAKIHSRINQLRSYTTRIKVL